MAIRNTSGTTPGGTGSTGFMKATGKSARTAHTSDAKGTSSRRAVTSEAKGKSARASFINKSRKGGKDPKLDSLG